ncbi:hypothetical protein [Stackebrandtia soli]|uniref:hypothetical protein n=1 Tax=Stackebrandtia soli TaxID=1892856 RepID=UPI0039E96603
MATHCPHCGWLDAEPYQTISRRLDRDSSQLVWTRCACGSLQLRRHQRGAEPVVVTRGRPTADLVAAPKASTA